MNNSLNREITWSALLRFTLPSIVMMVVLSLYTIVDGIFVSRLIGTDAFSAVNIVYPLSSLVIALGTMFGTGLTAIVSRKLGEGREHEARQNLTFVMLVAFGVGFVMLVGCLIFLKPLLRMLGANDAIFAYCYAYALPLVLFFPIDMLQLQFQTLFVANGKPHIGLVVTILGGLTNVVLDYVFIRYCGWGIAGAAIATGIGHCIPAVFGVCYFMYKRKAPLHYVRPKTDWRMLLHTMSNGSSEMVSNLSASITTLLYNLIMMRFVGPDGVAAIGIILYMDFVLIAIALGYSIGVAPLIAYNYGRGDDGRLHRLIRMSVTVCMTVGAAMTVISVLLAHKLTAVFTPVGSAVYELAATGMMIYAIGNLFKGLNIFSSAMFTAFSDGKISALLSFVRTLVCLSLCLVGLAYLFGVKGVWWATPLAELLAFLLSVFCMLRYRAKYRYGNIKEVG